MEGSELKGLKIFVAIIYIALIFAGMALFQLF